MPKLISSVALMLGCAVTLAGTAIVLGQEAKSAVTADEAKKTDTKPARDAKPDADAKSTTDTKPARDAKPAADAKSTTDTKPAADAKKPTEKPTAKESTATGPEKVLVDKGLTKTEKKFLFDEAAVIEKYDAAKPLLTDLQKAMYKYLAMMEFDEALGTMEMEYQMLQQESNALQMQITNTTNINNRMRGTMNNQLQTLRQQAAMYQAQTTELNTQITNAKAQAPKPEARLGAEADVERTRQTYIDAVKELETTLTPLLAQYHDVALDKSVIDALARLRKQTSVNYKLGPSEQVVAASIMVREMKKQIGLPTKSKPGKAKNAVKKKAKTKGA